MRQKLVAKIGEFEFYVTEGVADQKFSDDFDRFFKLFVLDDEEVDFLDRMFALSFMDVVFQSVEEDEVKPFVFDFVTEKISDYFSDEAKNIS